MRIGLGYDCHRFGEGDFITVGGVEIPFHFGVQAHSDGDVVMHAICDALLGAAALGDIGQHFPDTDPRFKDQASHVFLTEIHDKLKQNHYRIENIDTTIIAERPKMAPHIPRMREQIAMLLNITVQQISIKAKTNEKMGWLGRSEGIAAQAVVLLQLNR